LEQARTSRRSRESKKRKGLSLLPLFGVGGKRAAKGEDRRGCILSLGLKRRKGHQVSKCENIIKETPFNGLGGSSDKTVTESASFISFLTITGGKGENTGGYQ